MTKSEATAWDCFAATALGAILREPAAPEVTDASHLKAVTVALAADLADYMLAERRKRTSRKGPQRAKR